MADTTAAPRRSSHEIIATTEEVKQRLESKKESRRKSKKTSKDDDLDEAKRELVMDEHKRDIDELLASYSSDMEAVSRFTNIYMID